MPYFTTLASGSDGNSTLISDGNRHFLLDAGISATMLAASLHSVGVSPEDLHAIFVTHAHTDHICGLRVFEKRHRIPVFAANGCAAALIATGSVPGDLIHCFKPGDLIELSGVKIQSFRTSHDSPDSTDYTFSFGGTKLGFATDLGYVSGDVRFAILGCHAVLLEANHDPDILMNGSYPYQTKLRILGDKGHLSNETCAEFAADCVREGTKHITLGHISEHNNSTALARCVVSSALPMGFPLEIAPHKAVGRTVNI